jgi:prepilin-type processing-associated H-X9-DG protein
MRRAECTNNLKQIALAAHNYSDALGTFPTVETNVIVPPSDKYPYPTLWNAYSVYIFLLPYLDQGPLYNSLNFNMPSFFAPNTTVVAIGVRTLWCPSDPEVASVSVLPPERRMADEVAQAFTSYCPNLGIVSGSEAWSWGSFDGSNALRAIRPAEFTDGLSNTMFFAEWAYGKSGATQSFFARWDWSGGYLTMYPLNRYPYMLSFAGSFHPGGANFALADGSVRFLKDSIDSWPIDPRTRLPVGLSSYWDNTSFTRRWVLKPGSYVGVYQKLSTRAGGEIVSSDSY